MSKLIFSTALAGFALAAPIAAQAQQLPPAVVGVVDSARVVQGCTVCQAASQQLTQQQQQLRQRAQQLGLIPTTPNTPSALDSEGQAIQAAVNALPQGTQPDAALQARFSTYQTNVQNAQREVQTREAQIQRNQQYVLQQIQQRLAPAVQQIAQQRGASVVLDAGNIAWNSPAVDLTAAVVAVVNQNAAPFQINAPPPAQQPAANTPPATQQPAQPNRPRPQGR